MNFGLLTIHRCLILVCLALVILPLRLEADVERIVMLNWHPLTADEARRLTLAAAAWMNEEDADPDAWRSFIHSRALAMERPRDRFPGAWAPLSDGIFGWLVQSRDLNLVAATDSFPEPSLSQIEALVRDPLSGGRVGRLKPVAAQTSPRVWRQLIERLQAAGHERAGDEVMQLWSELVERAETGEGQAHLDHARQQAQRILAAAETGSESERSRLLDDVLHASAVRQWDEGQGLSAVWTTFEALTRLSVRDDSREAASRWLRWLEGLDGEQVRNLRQIDIDLPVILAMQEDAAGYLSADEPGTLRALMELADVYARLALFIPDMGFYLDQPVRSEVRRTIAACNPDPLLIGPLPRELYERCVRDLLALLDEGLATEELAGGRQGPFAPEFLRRELGLASWQRAAYLDGHLGWMLDAPCEPPAWANVLEWSLIVEHLVRWVPQRPVFFVGPRWYEALVNVHEDAIERAQVQQDWMDCLSGHGAERRDPVRRLLDRHERALGELQVRLAEAGEQFYREVVRPGGDIDLDGPADQTTGYRPEGLAVRPCPQADTCGARAELPVSRALMGLFPNAYLLADQLGMGDIELCYESVQWVERSAYPARKRDARVANYQGRLSFELVGTFERNEEPRTVFRYRLTAAETRHYLFAAADPTVLEMACPQDLVGSSIASTLSHDRRRLIPDRLTYFVSAPTTPEMQMVANWDRGSEWRDWFITGDRVEELESADGTQLQVMVQAQLAALSARRERQLAAPLTSPVRAEETDPIALAMARVADSTAMLRRLLEIHYSRVIRHHEPIRSMLAGESGLISRDRVRILRDEGVTMLQVPQVGMARSRDMRDQWEQLPVGLRELGQRAPEVDYGLERLESLMRISRHAPTALEGPEGQ